MGLVSSEIVYQSWLTYGTHVDFGVRKRYINNNKKWILYHCVSLFVARKDYDARQERCFC